MRYDSQESSAYCLYNFIDKEDRNWKIFGNDVYIGSNGIIYTKYTQNPHTIEPPFNIATQSASLDRYSLCKSPGTKCPYCKKPLSCC